MTDLERLLEVIEDRTLNPTGRYPSIIRFLVEAIDRQKKAEEEEALRQLEDDKNFWDTINQYGTGTD